MLFAELLDLARANAGALGQQALEHLRTGMEHSRLLHQRTVAIEGLAEGRAQRHRLALVARPLPQLVPGGENLGALGGEGVHGSAVAPAVDRMTDLIGDADDRVVVCSGPGLGRLSLPIAETDMLPSIGAAASIPDTGPPKLCAELSSFARIPPFAVGDVVERRLLGHRPRPPLGQIGPHVAVQHRPLRLVFGPVFGDVEGERRPVDVDGPRSALRGQGTVHVTRHDGGRTGNEGNGRSLFAAKGEI